MNAPEIKLAIALMVLLSFGRLDAAVTVYFYGAEAADDTNPTPSPLSVGPGSLGATYIGTGGGVNLSIGYLPPTGGLDPGISLFRADATIIPDGRTGNVKVYHGGFFAGAIEGDQNFAYLKFRDGFFSPFESIGQFHFEEDGTGWLVAIATTNTGTTVSDLRGNSDGRRITVAEGAAAILAASIPEPSTPVLVGFALSAFLLRRRIPD